MHSGGSHGRVILASHRLPVTLRSRNGAIQIARSDGGLATALDCVHREGTHLWIGSTGDGAASTADPIDLQSRFEAQRLVPVPLCRGQYRGYYDGFSNGVLWPVFHYMPDRIPLDSCGWNTYRDVNARFADVIAEAYRPSDVIWVHDYQLMLVPQLLRERIPDAAIGFFLHIPFPSFEVYRTLPWATPLLEGVLGADVVGFHTAAYARYFTRTAERLLGVDADLDRVRLADREVRLRVSPIGIDAMAFEERAASASVRAAAHDIRAAAGGRRIILGVDRLDYTKGINRRLLAFERLLTRNPALRDTVRLVQVAVPSRLGVASYRTMRRQLDELVGHINGVFATPEAMPVHYLNRAISQEELAALYVAADVMAVTPLRDGMNLVAKEFIASRVDDGGVLLLSEFAGASEELIEAVSVNPYDIDATADAMRDALAMPQQERRTRMRALRQRVTLHTVSEWASAFADEIRASRSTSIHVAVDSGHDEAALQRRMESVRDPVLLLDYDGTLVSFASLPGLASPDADLTMLLRSLSACCEVHVVSGRDRRDLEGWFGDVPLQLWAEHGAWLRRETGQWESTLRLETGWMDGVQRTMQRLAAATPGAVVERKSAAVAWHFRGSDQELADRQASRLVARLQADSQTQPFAVVAGARVVEARARGVSKGVVVRRLLASGVAPSRIVAIGDDTTDEDMFAALTDEAITICAGQRDTAARYRVAGPAAVRSLLQQMTAAGAAVSR